MPVNKTVILLVNTIQHMLHSFPSHLFLFALLASLLFIIQAFCMLSTEQLNQELWAKVRG